MKSSNSAHLKFIQDRLINVLGVNPDADFMVRLNTIIESIQANETQGNGKTQDQVTLDMVAIKRYINLSSSYYTLGHKLEVTQKGFECKHEKTTYVFYSLSNAEHFINGVDAGIDGGNLLSEKEN